MRLYRRFACAALALALAACQREAPSSAETAPVAAPASPAAQAATWFICDGIDAPVIYVAAQPDAHGAFSLREFDKTSAEFKPEQHLTRGEGDGAMGSVYTPFLANGAPYATMRALNPGMLEDESAAYTAPITEMRIGDRAVSCRWLERTRIIGFTTRRSIVVNEDADGDLIYHSYDFSQAPSAQRVDLDGAQRTTVFTLEVRGGSEETGPEGSIYRFEHDGYTYMVGVPDSGAATITVRRNDRPVQAETMLAYQAPPKNE